MTDFRLLFTIFLSFAVYSVNHARLLSEANVEATQDEDITYTEIKEELEDLSHSITVTTNLFMERFIKLLKPMEDGEQDTELTREERNILSNVYDFIVGKRPQYRSILKSIEQKEEQNVDDQNPEMDMIKYISQKIKKALHGVCMSVLDKIDDVLMPHANIAGSVESKVFYYTAKGDYYWYIAEIATGKLRDDSGKNALAAYTKAVEISTTAVPPTNPVRLRLALNFSTYYYDFYQSQDRACRLAKAAFNDAIAELDTLSEESLRETTLIMFQLRDNLARWTCDMKEDTEGMLILNSLPASVIICRRRVYNLCKQFGSRSGADLDEICLTL